MEGIGIPSMSVGVVGELQSTFFQLRFCQERSDELPHGSVSFHWRCHFFLGGWSVGFWTRIHVHSLHSHGTGVSKGFFSERTCKQAFHHVLGVAIAFLPSPHHLPPRSPARRRRTCRVHRTAGPGSGRGSASEAPSVPIAGASGTIATVRSARVEHPPDTCRIVRRGERTESDRTGATWHSRSGLRVGFPGSRTDLRGGESIDPRSGITWSPTFHPYDSLRLGVGSTFRIPVPSPDPRTPRGSFQEPGKDGAPTFRVERSKTHVGAENRPSSSPHPNRRRSRFAYRDLPRFIDTICPGSPRRRKSRGEIPRRSLPRDLPSPLPLEC